MEQMEDFCVSYYYGQGELLLLLPSSSYSSRSSHTHLPQSSSSRSHIVEIPPKTLTNKNKTKHIMKISHINVNIYGNYGRKVS
jgi:hypothetical protein